MGVVKREPGKKMLIKEMWEKDGWTKWLLLAGHACNKGVKGCLRIFGLNVTEYEQRLIDAE